MVICFLTESLSEVLQNVNSSIKIHISNTMEGLGKQHNNIYSTEFERRITLKQALNIFVKFTHPKEYPSDAGWV